LIINATVVLNCDKIPFETLPKVDVKSFSGHILRSFYGLRVTIGTTQTYQIAKLASKDSSKVKWNCPDATKIEVIGAPNFVTVDGFHLKVAPTKAAHKVGSYSFKVKRFRANGTFE
jgi:hypothetical protein